MRYRACLMQKEKEKVDEGCVVSKNTIEVISQKDNFYCDVLNGLAGKASRFVETRKRKLQLLTCKPMKI